MSGHKHQAAQQRREAFERWYVENCPDIAAEPIGSRLFTLQWSAHTAGREQGLREAKEVCEQNAKRWPDLRGFYVANECAAAIEQLRGK